MTRLWMPLVWLLSAAWAGAESPSSSSSEEAAALGGGAPLYTGDELKERLPANNHFVMFFAPWCGHCKRLEPTWEQLAELLNVDDSRVTVARVDCTKEKEACNEHDVTGYPTLKFFKMGDAEGVKFRGTRDLPTLSSFINEQLGDTASIDEGLTVPFEAPACAELTEDTFAAHVASGYHFVKFYAPWCGHCQKMAPTWEALAETFADSKAVSVSKVDCTQHRSVCSQHDVKGYPTLLWFEDGKKIEKYSGARTHEDFKAYISKMIDVDDAAKEEDSDEKDGAGQAVLVLTSDTFDHGVENEFVFVKFFAPWCGHCKRLAPTWDELGRKFINHGRVKIAKVDCSVESNKGLCAKEEVDGFPSLYLFRNGKRISEYEGSRTLEDLFDFVQEQINNVRDEL